MSSIKYPSFLGNRGLCIESVSESFRKLFAEVIDKTKVYDVEVLTETA